MRAIEIYFAETHKEESILHVHLLMFEQSCEEYEYMSIVEQEKKGFQELIDVKSRLYVELKNFTLE